MNARYRKLEIYTDLFPSFDSRKPYHCNDTKHPKDEPKKYDYDKLKMLVPDLVKPLVYSIARQTTNIDDLESVGVLVMLQQIKQCEKRGIRPSKRNLLRAAKKQMMRESKKQMGVFKKKRKEIFGLDDIKQEVVEEYSVGGLEGEDGKAYEIGDKATSQARKNVDKEAAESGDMFQLLSKTLSEDDYKIVKHYFLDEGGKRDWRKSKHKSNKYTDKRLRDVLEKVKAILPEGIENHWNKEKEE